MNGITQRPRRARTAGEKENRRRDILAAAAAMLGEAGFEQVTMSALAERAGLAKGTLYLYFRTREEVFLALFLDVSRAWCGHVIDAVWACRGSDEEVVRVLTGAVRSDPLFLELSARLTSVIERNVPPEVVIPAKREMFDVFGGLAGRLADVLNLPPQDGLRFAAVMLALLRGALDMDSNVLAGEADLPEEVATIVRMTSFETAFADGLRLVLAGLRARGPS